MARTRPADETIVSEPVLLSRIAIAGAFVAVPLAGQETSPTPARDPSAALRRELAAARTELALLQARLEAPAAARGTLGVTLTNEYLFRGIPQEDRGVIAQPWTELVFGLLDGGEDEFVHDLELTLGLWNSLHDGPTGGSGSVWYEADVYAGVSAGLGERWTAGITYTVYHSPNGTFATVEEIGCAATFDDTGLDLPIALKPSLSFAFETAGQTDGGRDLGIFAEFGIEPRFALGRSGGHDFDLIVPVKAGFSLNDYYEQPGGGGGDRVFGYVDAAIAFASTVPWLPGPGKPWTAELSLHYLVLGDSNEARNGGDASELLVSFELRTGF